MTARKVREMFFRVNIIVESDDDKFHAYAPALKGLHVGGDTEKEALENAEDAVIAYLRSLVMDGEPIPLTPILVESAPKKKAHSHHEQTLALSLT